MAHSIITCGEVHLSRCFCHTGMILKGHCLQRKCFLHQCTVDIIEAVHHCLPLWSLYFAQGGISNWNLGIWQLALEDACYLSLLVSQAYDWFPAYATSLPAQQSSPCLVIRVPQGEPSFLPLLSLMLLCLMSNIIWIFFSLESSTVSLFCKLKVPNIQRKESVEYFPTRSFNGQHNC